MPGFGRISTLGALEVVGQLDERRRRDDFHLGAGPGCFRSAGRRADQSFGSGVRADRRRPRARDRGIEPSRASSPNTVKPLSVSCGTAPIAAISPAGSVAALFRQVGGREIDGDAARRQREPRGDQRCAHALLGLRHGLVGQTDDIEGRQTGRDLHLHVHRAGLDALECHCRYALDHVPLGCTEG